MPASFRSKIYSRAQPRPEPTYESARVDSILSSGRLPQVLNAVSPHASWRRSPETGSATVMVRANLDLNRAAAAGVLAEFPDGPASLCLDPATDDKDECASDSRAKESSGPGDLLRSLLIISTILALRAAEPHVKRWWSNQALPAVKSMRNRLASTRETDSQVASAESSTLMESAPADASRGVVAALEVLRDSMSSAEARDHFVAASVARRFSEEQLRVLRNVRIEDESGSLELADAHCV